MTSKSVRHALFSPSSPLLALLLLLMMAASTSSQANELRLAVNLGLSPQQAAVKYKPLLSYLGKITGQRIQLVATPNSLAHWEAMRHDGYELVLDNPAFTAYRASKMNYTVIGKLPDVLSFSLVTHVDEMMFEPGELVGRKVASQPSPSITALRLDEIFPNPMRQPQFIKVDTHTEALELVLKGRAAGAMVPTGMVASYPDLNPVYTSDQIPAPGFSVSAEVSRELREKIRKGLLDANKSPAGRAMLEALNVPSFESATSATYTGMDTMLTGLYGY